MISTVDLLDAHGDEAAVSDAPLRQFGGVRAFGGEIATVRAGCVRDSVALSGLALGVTALGTHPRASGKAGTGEIDVPVTIGGITFRPGATIASDDDGVVGGRLLVREHLLHDVVYLGDLWIAGG